MIPENDNNTKKVILLAQYEGRNNIILSEVSRLSAGKSRSPASNRPISSLIGVGMEMGDYITGLYYRFAQNSET